MPTCELVVNDTIADPTKAGFARDVAKTVTAAGFGTVIGAV
jgi:hypothetical protein